MKTDLLVVEISCLTQYTVLIYFSTGVSNHAMTADEMFIYQQSGCWMDVIVPLSMCDSW